MINVRCLAWRSFDLRNNACVSSCSTRHLLENGTAVALITLEAWVQSVRAIFVLEILTSILTIDGLCAFVRSAIVRVEMFLSWNIVRKFQNFFLPQADVFAMLSACILAIELPDLGAFWRKPNGLLETLGNFLSKDDLTVPKFEHIFNDTGFYWCSQISLREEDFKVNQRGAHAASEVVRHVYISLITFCWVSDKSFLWSKVMNTVSHAVWVVRWSILWILYDNVTLFFPGYIDVIWIQNIGILRHIWPSNVFRDLLHVGARTILKNVEKHRVIWMSSIPIFYHQSDLKVYSDFYVRKYLHFITIK